MFAANQRSLLNWVYTRLLYPSLEPSTYKGLSARLNEFRKREQLSLRENLDLQWQDVVKILKHAQETSPFYQRRFADAGLNVAKVQSPEDLKRIPPLTREDLRMHLKEIQSQTFRDEDLQAAATGGTTDTPVPILRSKESVAWKSAVQWRFNAWAGMYPGDKAFYLWGARQDYSENPSWRWRFYENQLMKRVWAPTSLFNSEVFETYREMLNSFRPRIIYAYPTPLALFCEYLRDCKRTFHRPTSVICTAESLMPYQRELIREMLGCEIFENYGARDFAMIAGECNEHRGLHLNPAAAFVEYQAVEGAEVGGLKELLVTDLLNYGMPLIRYKINDCTMEGPDQCNCGIGYPLMQKIVGRTMDNFLMPNGDVVPGISFQNRVLKVCPGLSKTQIIQEALGEFRVRYVPGPGFSAADLELLRGNLRRFLPDGLQWTFEQVADIPRERSGKTRFCISRVTTSPSRLPREVSEDAAQPQRQE